MGHGRDTASLAWARDDMEALRWMRLESSRTLLSGLGHPMRIGSVRMRLVFRPSLRWRRGCRLPAPWGDVSQ